MAETMTKCNCAYLLLFRNSSVYAALSANLHSTYGFICVKATEVHVFLCTSLPSRALPLTMQYGTPILRHRAGRKMTSYRNKKKLIFHRDKVKEETWTLWSLLRVKKLVCFDLHRDFRWRNSNIIASYHFFFFLIQLVISKAAVGGTYFDGINIMGNDNQLRLLVFHQCCDGVHTWK